VDHATRTVPSDPPSPQPDATAQLDEREISVLLLSGEKLFSVRVSDVIAAKKERLERPASLPDSVLG
ncbi:unnamed protein product, partial [Amoebophrya sp. A120]